MKILALATVPVVALVAAGSAASGPAVVAGGAVWSPDSKTLAFVERTADGRDDIYRVNVDGTDPQNLTADDSTPLLHAPQLAPHGNPAWSPGGRIAYTIDRSDPNQRDVEYWTMNSDGTDKQRVAVEATEQTPSWSPDATQLTMEDFETVVAVSVRSGRQATVWRRSPAGSSIWSPRDRRIALEAVPPDQQNNTEVYTTWVDGSHVHRLTTARGSDWPVAWSPDAKRIAFASQRLIVAAPRRDHAVALFVMDSNGRHQHQVGSGQSASFSPTGRRLVYSNGTSVYVVNADGSHRRLLARGIDPHWSPDGRLISFTREGAVFLIHPDGTGLHLLAP